MKLPKFDNLNFSAWCLLNTFIFLSLYEQNLTPEENLSAAYSKYIITKDDQKKSIERMKRLGKKLVKYTLKNK